MSSAAVEKKPGIPEVALGVVFVCEGIGAPDPRHLIDDLQASLGGEHLGHSRFLAAGKFLLDPPGRIVDHESACFHFRCHIGKLGPDELVVSYGFTESDPLPRIIEPFVIGCLRNPERHRSGHGPDLVEDLRQVFDAFIYLRPQQILFGKSDIIENKLPRYGPPAA